MKLDERQFPYLRYFLKTQESELFGVVMMFLNLDMSITKTPKPELAQTSKAQLADRCMVQMVRFVTLKWYISSNYIGVSHLGSPKKQGVQMSKLPRRQGYIRQKHLYQPPCWDCSKGGGHFKICIPTYHCSCLRYEWSLTWPSGQVFYSSAIGFVSTAPWQPVSEKVCVGVPKKCKREFRIYNKHNRLQIGSVSFSSIVLTFVHTVGLKRWQCCNHYSLATTFCTSKYYLGFSLDSLD